MKLSLVILAAGLAIAATGCTDAEKARLASYGDEATITCWSGSTVIYQGESTGKVVQGAEGGLFYKEKATGEYVRAFADCIIRSK